MLYSLLAAVALSGSVAAADTVTAVTPYVVDVIPTPDPQRSLVLRSDRSWSFETGSFPDAASGAPRLALPLDFSSFCCPVAGGEVFTPFGNVGELLHTGVDVSAGISSPVHAAWDGEVVFSSDNDPGLGRTVRIAHDGGLETVYANLRSRSVEAGARVRAGDVIASVDSLDGAGPHLHFEIRYSELALDPFRIIDFGKGCLSAPFYILRRDRLPEASGHSSASVGEQREIYLARVVMKAEEERLERERQERLAREEAERKAREAAALAAAKKYHTIRSGDTLSRIAQKYHTTVKAICRLNGIKENTTLRVGKTLRVK